MHSGAPGVCMVEFAATGVKPMKRFLYFVAAALFIMMARWLGPLNVDCGSPNNIWR